MTRIITFDIIPHWAHQQKLEFSHDPHKKATEVLFSCKNRFQNFHQFYETAKEQKALGLILDTGLCFEKHLNEEIIRAKSNLGIIKHLPILLLHKNTRSNV